MSTWGSEGVADLVPYQGDLKGNSPFSIMLRGGETLFLLRAF